MTITNSAESILHGLSNDDKKLLLLEALTNTATAKANLYTARQIIRNSEFKLSVNDARRVCDLLTQSLSLV